MPTISTTCPSCREHIDLASGHCALLGGPDRQPVAYAFVCPRCDQPIVRRADKRAAAMLVAGGASAHGARERTVVLSHPEQPASGPVLTVDDLIDFHVMLGGDGWFERLAGLVVAAGDADRPTVSAPATPQPPAAC